MKLYWMLKQIPELQGRTAKECRQAIWQVGFKPYRHWQMWAVLLLASLLMLLGAGYAFMGWMIETLSVMAFWSIMIPSLVIPPILFRLFYIHFLRPYLAQVQFDSNMSHTAIWVRRMAMAMSTFMLFLVTMFVIDWGINSFDEAPIPRIKAINNWPEPIPDAENGYLYMIGMGAASDASPSKIGRTYVDAVNEANLAYGKKSYPEQSKELKYVGYKGVRDSSKVFCNATTENCWVKLKKENRQVAAWATANRELLARYKTLQKYAKWQHAMLNVLPETPIPSYQELIRGQGLLQVEAMQAIARGEISDGLALIEKDMNFSRRMLAGKDSILGKMIAKSLMTRDLAWLLQTLQAHPEMHRSFQGRLIAMVEPFTVQQVSVADAFRFEEKFVLSILSPGYFDSISSSIAGKGIAEWWVGHHHKRNAAANHVISIWDGAIRQAEIQSVNDTPPMRQDAVNPAIGMERWYYNQVAIFLLNIAMPGFDSYANKLYDMNALNTLVRLKLTLVEKRIKQAEVSEFLSGCERSLWNPETGKPFEWDEKRKQIFFIPIGERIQNFNIGGVAGRVGVDI